MSTNTEFGIFNDEGLIEGGFVEMTAATYAAATRYDEADKVYVAEVCEHENERDHCEECASDTKDELEAEADPD